MIATLFDNLETIILEYFKERKQPIENGEMKLPLCYQFEIPQKTEGEAEHFPHFLLVPEHCRLTEDEETIAVLIGIGVSCADGYKHGCRQLLTMASGLKLSLVANKLVAKKFILQDSIETAVLPKDAQNPPYYYGGVSLSYKYKYLTPLMLHTPEKFGGGYRGEET